MSGGESDARTHSRRLRTGQSARIPVALHPWSIAIGKHDLDPHIDHVVLAAESGDYRETVARADALERGEVLEFRFPEGAAGLYRVDVQVQGVAYCVFRQLSLPATDDGDGS